MKTIHPLELEALIETNTPVEIVDLRPHADFEKRHIVGAHSLPFGELTPETLVHARELPLTEPLYVASEKGIHAQIATEKMEGYGLDDLVVIEGGMLAWERNGLPVDRSQSVMNWTVEHRKKMADMGVATDLCVTAAPY
jgi:rhodanese-related sulfurtransferase